MAYHSLKDIVKICDKKGVEFWQVILSEQSKETLESEESVLKKTEFMYSAMKSALENYDENARSQSKMSGGDGAKLERFADGNGGGLLGSFLSKAVTNAVKTAESNACMKRIVAAPTAGSCGVIPAVFSAYQEEFNADDEKMAKALLVSSGIGCVIAENASVSGASGGCQAEIGSASAMAAGGLAYLEGGDNGKILSAVSFALKNMLGLVCDPVAGLVEVPCVKRNASGAVNAVLAVHLAMAGVESVIPADEVIDAMYEIGCAMPSCLRETSQAGLAKTPTGEKIRKNI